MHSAANTRKLNHGGLCTLEFLFLTEQRNLEEAIKSWQISNILKCPGSFFIFLSHFQRFALMVARWLPHLQVSSSHSRQAESGSREARRVTLFFISILPSVVLGHSSRSLLLIHGFMLLSLGQSRQNIASVLPCYKSKAGEIPSQCVTHTTVTVSEASWTRLSQTDP